MGAPPPPCARGGLVCAEVGFPELWQAARSRKGVWKRTVLEWALLFTFGERNTDIYLFKDYFDIILHAQNLTSYFFL